MKGYGEFDDRHNQLKCLLQSYQNKSDNIITIIDEFIEKLESITSDDSNNKLNKNIQK